MARNGSGVWSSPSGFPVVSGTTISSTDFNSLINDIGAEITASMPVAGTAPMTGTLRAVLGTVSLPGYTFTGDTDTGIYSTGANVLAIATGGVNAVTVSSTQTTAWTGKAVGKAFDVDAITSVASASTCDIGAAATSEVLITGTTTITAFGTSNAGIRRKGRFEGALTLTHNATSLIIPGGANITTAANDRFEALSLGSGNWIVTSYTPTTGRSGTVRQVANTTLSALTSSAAATIPYDNSKPQSGEGTQWTTLAITPTSATNKLRIDVVINAASTATGQVIVALFQDSTADALAVAYEYVDSAGGSANIVLTHYMTAGTTSSTTFKVRFGLGTAGTVYINGDGSGTQVFNGTSQSSITITEIVP